VGFAVYDREKIIKEGKKAFHVENTAAVFQAA
jgi:hypothetical protein